MDQKPSLKPFLMIALALIGLGDTLYLSYFEHLGLTPGCALHGCELVLTSIYSRFYGVPLAYIGLVYYVHTLLLSVLLAFDPSSKGLRWGMFLYAMIGVALSIRFEWLQVFSIGAICMYCAISALVTLAIFVITLRYLMPARFSA